MDHQYIVDRDIMGKCNIYIYIHIVVFTVYTYKNVTYNCWLIQGCNAGMYILFIYIYIYTHIYLNIYVYICIYMCMYVM